MSAEGDEDGTYRDDEGTIPDDVSAPLLRALERIRPEARSFGAEFDTTFTITVERADEGPSPSNLTLRVGPEGATTTPVQLGTAPLDLRGVERDRSPLACVPARPCPLGTNATVRSKPRRVDGRSKPRPGVDAQRRHILETADPTLRRPRLSRN